MTVITKDTRERRKTGAPGSGPAGRQRGADDRRRALVSDTLATVRGSRFKRPMDGPLERARAVLERMRAS